MNVKERLILFVDYLGVSRSEFERNCKLSNGFIDKSGDNTRISSLEKISIAYPELNISWLRTGVGSMLKQQQPGGIVISTHGEQSPVTDVSIGGTHKRQYTNTSQESYKHPSIIDPSKNNARPIEITNFMNVPLVPVRASAGYLCGYGDPEYIDSLPTVPVIVDKSYKGKYMCFEVDGDSMYDGTVNSLFDKDVVLGREVKRDLWRSKLHIDEWDFIIVHRTEGITIKRIIGHDVENGIIHCHPTNPIYDDFRLHLDDVAELYNVIKLVDRTRRR